MCSEEYKCAHIVILQHSVTTHSWLDCTLIQVSYLHVEEVYLGHPIRYDRCSMSCLHARGISDLPMGNGPGLQQILCKSHRVKRVQDNSPLFALRVCMLRSHRIKAHATVDTMHKSLGFEVMHCLNSPRPKRPLESVCAHAGDGQPCLA